MNDWQPGKTAPKDGTDILGYWTREGGKSAYGVTAYMTLADDWLDSGGDVVRRPDHWMPLPPPP